MAVFLIVLPKSDHKPAQQDASDTEAGRCVQEIKQNIT